MHISKNGAPRITSDEGHRSFLKYCFSDMAKVTANSSLILGKMIGEKEFLSEKSNQLGIKGRWQRQILTKAFDFLMKVKNKASGLTLRETKGLPEKMKKRLPGNEWWDIETLRDHVSVLSRVSRRSELRYCAVAEKIWGFEL